MNVEKRRLVFNLYVLLNARYYLEHFDKVVDTSFPNQGGGGGNSGYLIAWKCPMLT